MKKILNPMSYAAFAGILLFAACNNNTTETTETTDSTSAMATDTIANNNAMTNDNKDADFVKDVIRSNAMELKMLAAGKTMGTDKQLKDNAKEMEADHKKLATTMMDYASKNNIAIDTADMDHDDMDDDKKGKDWDKDWADKMVDEHEKVIDKFEDAQDDVRDSTLKNIITETLPKLQHHLEMSKALKDKLDK